MWNFNRFLSQFFQEKTIISPFTSSSSDTFLIINFFFAIIIKLRSFWWEKIINLETDSSSSPTQLINKAYLTPQCGMFFFSIDSSWENLQPFMFLIFSFLAFSSPADYIKNRNFFQWNSINRFEMGVFTISSWGSQTFFDNFVPDEKADGRL